MSGKRKTSVEKETGAATRLLLRSFVSMHPSKPVQLIRILQPIKLFHIYVIKYIRNLIIMKITNFKVIEQYVETFIYNPSGSLCANS